MYCFPLKSRVVSGGGLFRPDLVRELFYVESSEEGIGGDDIPLCETESHTDFEDDTPWYLNDSEGGEDEYDDYAGAEYDDDYSVPSRRARIRAKDRFGSSVDAFSRAIVARRPHSRTKVHRVSHHLLNRLTRREANIRENVARRKSKIFHPMNFYNGILSRPARNADYDDVDEPAAFIPDDDLPRDFVFLAANANVNDDPDEEEEVAVSSPLPLASNAAGLTFDQLVEQMQYRDLTPDDYALLLGLDESVAPKTTDRDTLESATVEDEWVMDDDGEVVVFETCQICMDEYVEGSRVRLISGCGHRFHSECLERYLMEFATKCPVCRFELES